jgi:inhibitor of the pro-sigma K processing machinery
MVEWYLLAIGAAIILSGLYVIGMLLYRPLRLLIGLLACLVTGTVLLAILNFVLGFVDMHVAFNPFTVLIAGMLQIPGLVLLVLLTVWFA